MPRSSSSSPPRPRRQAGAPRPKLLLAALALLLAACVLPRLPTAAALTREQAEQIDWHRRGVGKVTSAFFVDRSSSASSEGSGSGAGSASDAILVAAAREGTVALLEASSGEIVWRRLLDARERLLSAGPLGPAGAALTLSSVGEGGGAEGGPLLILRAWRAADGALLWDRAVSSCGGSSLAAAAAVGASSDGSVAVVACGGGGAGRATAFDGASGLERWSVALPVNGEVSLSLAVAPAGASSSSLSSAVSVAWASASELGAASLSGRDGSALSGEGGSSNKIVPSAARPLSPASLALAPGTGAAGPAAAALSLDGRRLCSSLGAGGSAAQCVPLPAEAGDCSSGRLSAGGGGGGGAEAAEAVAVASCSAGAVAVALGSSSAKPPRVLELFAGATAGAAFAAPASGSEGGEGAYAGVSPATRSGSGVGGEAGAVEVSSPLFPACSAPPPGSSGSSASLASAPSSPQLTPERAWLGRLSSSSTPSPSPAVLVAARDGTLSLTVAAASEEHGEAPAAKKKSPLPPLWVRHEALARSAAASAAVAPLFAPLPPPGEEAGGLSSSSSSSSKMPFSSLLRLEWLAARSRLPGAAAGLSALEAAELRQLRAEQARRGARSADARGFRQAALVLSDSGTLFALHTGDGAVLWRADGVAEAVEGDGGERRRRAVVHWRSSHSHSPSSSSPSSSSSSSPLVAVFSGGSFSVVDAFSGSVVESGKLPFAPVRVVELPGAGATRERPDAAFLLVGEFDNENDAADDDGRGPPVALFPPTESTLEAAEALEAQSPLRFWLQDREAGTLTGFVVSRGEGGKGKGSGGSDNDLARRLSRFSSVAWRHAFGGPGSLLAVAAPSARDAAPAAAAKVLGDRSMKLRLAPGALLFVASANGGGGEGESESGDGENEALAESSSSPSASSGITASILDAVSGQFVFRQAHASGAGPVLATWAENSVYYHFADGSSSSSSAVGSENAAKESALSDLAADGSPAPSPPRWLVGSMELYDAARGKGLSAGALALGAARGLLLKKKGAKSSSASSPSTPSSGFEQSSFDPPPAEVLRATFSVPYPASTLSTTASARGVAARWLLLGTAATGDLLAFDRRWLDPRRPVAAGVTGQISPSSPEALEGLPPYHPDLPVVQGMSPTHGARVPGLSSVAAAPAGLESTCLLLVAGERNGDFFGTRAQPASSFDALPPDFPFGLLLAATAATLAGAAALRVAADREALRQQWA